MSYRDVFDSCKFSYYDRGSKCVKKSKDIYPLKDCKDCKYYTDEVSEERANKTKGDIMNKNLKIDKSEVKDRMTLLLQVMQQTMLTTGVAIGFDLEKHKLVLKDVETGLISRVDLEDLNGIFIKGDK